MRRGFGSEKLAIMMEIEDHLDMLTELNAGLDTVLRLLKV